MSYLDTFACQKSGSLCSKVSLGKGQVLQTLCNSSDAFSLMWSEGLKENSKGNDFFFWV